MARDLKDDFPALKQTVHNHPFVYLDSAATSHKPLSVIEAIRSFYADSYATVHRAVYSTAAAASEAYEAVREKVKTFINAKESSEIIFTRGTTTSINIVASGFGKAFVSAGDEVLITEMEHHSNIVPWQMMCEARGARLIVAPFLDSGELDMQAFKKLLSPKTKIVAVAHVSNVLGTVNPIEEIVKLAHAIGAKVLVDAAQSAPHLLLDVQLFDADFLVFSGHKLFGPTGIGILYGKKALLEAIPPFEGGGDMIETVTFEKTTYNVPPLKFEAGTPSIAEVIGLGAAIDYIEAHDRKKIMQLENQLLIELQAGLLTIPDIQLIGIAPHKTSLQAFHFPGIHPLDIASLLDLQGIAIRSGHLCAQPTLRHYGLTSLCRASLALYNTSADIERFIAALHAVIKQLR